MRRVQDFYFKKAKKENYPARSVYKLEEAQKKYRFLKQGQRVVDFGCHPGSWSLYAADIVGPNGLVVGVDLQKTNLSGQKGHAEMHCLCYDVYADDMVDRLQKICPGFHVVLSDMAPRTTGNQYSDHQHSLRLVRRLLALCRSLLHENGSFYCKVFQGEDFPDFVEECRVVFETVKVVKPDSSRRESREVFVLGRNYKKQSKN
jgi:23S rRNA (uridine2552-2'-O)-methyltransferase